MNNRPISHDYDSEVDDCLTPNHLLYGRRIEWVCEENGITINEVNSEELSRREKILHESVNHFWDVWRKEYLTSLRESQRLKKSKDEKQLCVNDVVIVYDKHQPRHLWKLAIVTELIHGRDNVIRGAKLKLGSGSIVQRPLNKLYLLEIHDGTNERNDESKAYERPKRKAAELGEMKRKEHK